MRTLLNVVFWAIFIELRFFNLDSVYQFDQWLVCGHLNQFSFKFGYFWLNIENVLQSRSLLRQELFVQQYHYVGLIETAVECLPPWGANNSSFNQWIHDFSWFNSNLENDVIFHSYSIESIIFDSKLDKELNWRS